MLKRQFRGVSFSPPSPTTRSLSRKRTTFGAERPLHPHVTAHDKGRNNDAETKRLIIYQSTGSRSHHARQIMLARWVPTLRNKLPNNLWYAIARAIRPGDAKLSNADNGRPTHDTGRTAKSQWVGISIAHTHTEHLRKFCARLYPLLVEAVFRTVKEWKSENGGIAGKSAHNLKQTQWTAKHRRWPVVFRSSFRQPTVNVQLFIPFLLQHGSTRGKRGLDFCERKFK